MVYIFTLLLYSFMGSIRREISWAFSYGVHETMSHLTLIRQWRDESVLDFVKFFRDIKNWCFHSSISKRDLTNSALNGLCSSIKGKLEYSKFLTVISCCKSLLVSKFVWKMLLMFIEQIILTWMPQNAVMISRTMKIRVSHCWVCWVAQNKSVSCPSVKLIHKNRQEGMKLTFHSAKCYRIFDCLLKKVILNSCILFHHLMSSKEGLIASGTTIFLMRLMIVMFSVGRSNCLLTLVGICTFMTNSFHHRRNKNS